MGLDALTWTGVDTYLAEFWGAGMINTGLKSILALAIGAFGLAAIIRAITK